MIREQQVDSIILDEALCDLDGVAGILVTLSGAVEAGEVLSHRSLFTLANAVRNLRKQIESAVYSPKASDAA